MKQIKMFKVHHEIRLEESVNDYLRQLDSSYSVIDIKYNAFLNKIGGETFTAMVIYEQN